MNYLSQLKGFWNWRKLNILSSKQADLYFAILECGNSAFWKEKFNIPNSTLESMCQMSRSELHKQRNVLIQFGLIGYDKGVKGKAGIYNICFLYDTHLDTNMDTHIDTHLDTNMEHIHKTNTETKTKPIKEKIIKEKLGQFSNVLLTTDELDKLKGQYSDYSEKIENLSTYLASTGKQYKSHYATILCWSRKETTVQTPSKAKIIDYNGEQNLF